MKQCPHCSVSSEQRDIDPADGICLDCWLDEHTALEDEPLSPFHFSTWS